MTFDPDRWLEEGRANKHLLPDGVTLPEPEIDYEAWWPALRAYHTSRRWAHDPDVLTDHDKAIIRALIAAYEHAPKAAAAATAPRAQVTRPPTSTVGSKVAAPATSSPTASSGRTDRCR